jgi:hypothetical protein
MPTQIVLVRFIAGQEIETLFPVFNGISNIKDLEQQADT